LDSDGDAMAVASEVFGDHKPEERVREIRSWLKAKGVTSLEPVSLFCDQLSKETVTELEQLADSITKSKSPSAFKRAIVKGIPRQAVLKPAHTAYRLQNQKFALGDRVTMVRDSGAVPLSEKGVVIGINANSMDVLWDVPFMSGVTLGDRCSVYRGLTVEFNSCLNLSNPQFVTSTNPKAPPPPPITTPFKPRYGPRPVIQPAPGQNAAAGFRPAPQPSQSASVPVANVKIMSNPNRAKGSHVNGRGAGGGHLPAPMNHVVANGRVNGPAANHAVNGHGRGYAHVQHPGPTTNMNPPGPEAIAAPATNGIRGGVPRGRGGMNGPRGRGIVNGFYPRAAPRGGGLRGGRGRGSLVS